MDFAPAGTSQAHVTAPPTGDSLTAAPAGVRRALTLLSSHLVVAVVALVVIGGATRVMEAGLACPDWPLCYGALLPGRQMNLQVFLEWFHRLDAFLVGLALIALLAVSLRWAAVLPRWLPWLSGLALLLVAAQGALGALTVIQLLAAGTVTAHLATALLLLLVLSSLHQLLTAPVAAVRPPLWWALLCGLATLLLLGQCVLGASMASQWAADLCLQAGEGCRWLLAHRLGAYPAALAILTLAVGSLFTGPAAPGPRPLALTSGLLVMAQVVLGVQTLRLQLQVPAVTIAHQLLAGLLVALLGALLGRCLLGLAPLRQPTLEAVHG
ncbi:heme A synthase [Synechococcus sp. CBW1004]|uniref:COX15/CtaA family protein n=1 Tax=Synechococcus sp. CBW1004 TaxID=1353136 RepID=UPI00351B12B5